MTQQLRWHLHSTLQALADHVAKAIQRRAESAIGEHGSFRIVLSGGDTPRPVYERLRAADSAWAAWEIYFGDERCLPPATAGRNDAMADAAWLAHVPVLPERVHRIPAERGPVAAANAYAALLEAVGPFDLVLLGLGEDGHAASLFPGHELGDTPSSPAALPVEQAPVPPPQRVSMSARRLSETAAVFFLVAGESKRASIERWRRGDDIPAAHIKPPHGIDVFVTRDAVR